MRKNRKYSDRYFKEAWEEEVYEDFLHTMTLDTEVVYGTDTGGEMFEEELPFIDDEEYMDSETYDWSQVDLFSSDRYFIYDYIYYFLGMYILLYLDFVLLSTLYMVMGNHMAFTEEEEEENEYLMAKQLEWERNNRVLLDLAIIWKPELHNQVLVYSYLGKREMVEAEIYYYHDNRKVLAYCHKIVFNKFFRIVKPIASVYVYQFLFEYEDGYHSLVCTYSRETMGGINPWLPQYLFEEMDDMIWFYKSVGSCELYQSRISNHLYLK